ncbi:MAG: phosphatidate cytidylyltransferase [Spirochaetia bacterium]|nr:phosphatidate cytidylyltransferase [Spirochaetia bacterium]
MNETVKRIISGILIAIIYGTFFQIELWNFLPLYLFICAVTIIVLSEFYSMFLDEKLDVYNKTIGIIFALFFITINYLQSLKNYRLHHDLGSSRLNEFLDFIPESSISIYATFILMFITLGIYNILTSRLKAGIYTIGIVFFGVIYIPLTISFILLLRGQPNGVFYIWLVSFITVMTDTCGYFFGKNFGRHKLPLPVSPNKTWEGYCGAFIMQLLLTIGFNEAVKNIFEIPGFDLTQITLISILIYLTSVFGDLFESLVKRNANAKDSGNFLPGHGGLLDRVDSIMFSLPVFYFYILIVG